MNPSPSAKSVFINHYSCSSCGALFQRAGALLEPGKCPDCHSEMAAALCDEILPGLGVAIVHASPADLLSDPRIELWS